MLTQAVSAAGQATPTPIGFAGQNHGMPFTDRKMLRCLLLTVVCRSSQGYARQQNGP